MKKLTEEDLEDLNGGFDGWGCFFATGGITSTMLGAASVLVLGTNPLGWALLAFGAASAVYGIHSNPYA